MEIQTLIPDVYRTVLRKDGWFDEKIAEAFAQDVSKRLQTQLGEAKGPPTLRLSQMGPRCPCALWHSIHTPELAEPLPPWAEIKYSYGHIIEALAIVLSKASGHEVTGEQDAVTVDGIVGHRDCIIDGCLVDVKSTSSMGFHKFKNGTLGEDDPFGYLEQLDGYLVGSLDDPLVRVKDKAYILAIDKSLGHLALYEHTVRRDHILQRIKEFKEYVGRNTSPVCTCQVVPDGKSGNIRLGLQASYSPFKYSCFPHLRTFLYSDGPRYLVKVDRKPDVPEVDKHGKIVYN